MQPEAASESSLKTVPHTELSLKGIAIGPKSRCAVIANEAGSQEVFFEGQEVFGLGRLERVEKNSALIKTESGDIELRIAAPSGEGHNVVTSDNKSGSDKPPLVAAVPALTTLPGQKPPPAKYIVINTPYISNTAMYSFSVKRDWLNEISGNTQRLLSEAEIAPYVVNGTGQGYEVKGLAIGGIYEQIGLQPGDIILKVNNREIHGLREARQLIESLRMSNTMSIEIERAGQTITLTYEIH